MDPQKCWCNVPYIPSTEVDARRSKRKIAKCGKEVNFKDGVLGCNLYCPVKNVKKVQIAIQSQERFKKYKLSDFVLDFEMEWPKCIGHNLYMQVKVCEAPGPNEGRVFFCCDAKRPNAQCRSFFWEDHKYVFNGQREDDAKWLKTYGELELQEAFQKIEKRKEEESKKVKEDIERRREEWYQKSRMNEDDEAEEEEEDDDDIQVINPPKARKEKRASALEQSQAMFDEDD